MELRIHQELCRQSILFYNTRGHIHGKQGKTCTQKYVNQRKSMSNRSLLGSQAKTKQACLLSISELTTFDPLQILIGGN